MLGLSDAPVTLPDVRIYGYGYGYGCMDGER
jgi:hypothetical protein